MTPETIARLEEVFGIGGTDREACFYADISQQTLYDYQEKHPEFIERKEALKEKPILKARQSVVKALDDPEIALKFLERKKKDEFSVRQEVTFDSKYDDTLKDIKGIIVLASGQPKLPSDESKQLEPPKQDIQT